jgi:hypothetical protein
MAASAARFWSLIDTAGPAALDRGPRPRVQPVTMLAPALAPLLAGLPPLRRDAAQALAHLWHDDLDAAHVLCQAHEGDADNDHVHALLHRREGDFANATYWFAEVGAHPAYAAMAVAAVELGLGDLLASGAWSPASMVDACRRALRDGDRHAALVALQAREFRALAQHLLAG